MENGSYNGERERERERESSANITNTQFFYKPDALPVNQLF